MWSTGRAGLHHARKSSFLRSRRSRAATIFNHVNVVAGAEHLDRWPGHADFGPEAGHEDFFLPVPRWLRGTRDRPMSSSRCARRPLAGKHVEQLRPDVAAERFGFDGGKDGWDAEFLGHLGKEGDVVDERCAVDTWRRQIAFAVGDR